MMKFHETAVIAKKNQDPAFLAFGCSIRIREIPWKGKIMSVMHDDHVILLEQYKGKVERGEELTENERRLYEYFLNEVRSIGNELQSQFICSSVFLSCCDPFS